MQRQGLPGPPNGAALSSPLTGPLSLYSANKIKQNLCLQKSKSIWGLPQSHSFSESFVHSFIYSVMFIWPLLCSRAGDFLGTHTGSRHSRVEGLLLLPSRPLSKAGLTLKCVRSKRKSAAPVESTCAGGVSAASILAECPPCTGQAGVTWNPSAQRR